MSECIIKTLHSKMQDLPLLFLFPMVNSIAEGMAARQYPPLGNPGFATAHSITVQDFYFYFSQTTQCNKLLIILFKRFIFVTGQEHDASQLNLKPTGSKRINTNLKLSTI